MKKTFILIACLTSMIALFSCNGNKQEALPENVFVLQNPDYEKSPYTGMTREHWIQAAEYLLNGAFTYIDSLDDQMDFPKQLDKNYPRGENDIPVAQLVGLARTLFVAAPLLKNNPE